MIFRIASLSILSVLLSPLPLSAEVGPPKSGKTKATLDLTVKEGFEVPKTLADLVRITGKAAESGNVLAQLLLGNIYSEGMGVPIDMPKAAHWYQKAADQGNTAAQYLIGSMFEKGEGVTLDKEKAVHYFKMAAEKGSLRAQFDLAEIYRTGNGIDEDISEAARWYKKAADQGMPQAQVVYAQMLENGIGVEKNTKEAEKLIHSAFTKKAGLFDFYSLSNSTLDIPLEGITHATLIQLSYRDPKFPQTDEEAYKWAETNQKNPTAQILLGLMYSEGVSVAKDLKQAVYWLESASRHETPPAISQIIARLYYYGGPNLKADRERAVGWLEVAVSQNDPVALYDLGRMYYYGDVVTQDKKKAADLFAKSAQKEYSKAQTAIGQMLYNGDGIAENKPEGIKWLKKAAKLGSVAALFDPMKDIPFATHVLNPKEIEEKYQTKKPEELAEHIILKNMPDLNAYTYSAQSWYEGRYGEGWGSSYKAIKKDKVKECEKAAKAGDSESQYTLACMYFTGVGKGHNLGLALKWFEKSAENKNPKAQYAMGVFTYFGKANIKPDTTKALEWFKKSSDNGYEEAKKALSIIVEK